MRNSSYNLIPILLKLCRHCDHALKICMWLGYTPQINFCHFLAHLSRRLIGAVVSTCNILAEYVVAGYGLISLPSTVKAILS